MSMAVITLKTRAILKYLLNLFLNRCLCPAPLCFSRGNSILRQVSGSRHIFIDRAGVRQKYDVFSLTIDSSLALTGEAGVISLHPHFYYPLFEIFGGGVLY